MKLIWQLARLVYKDQHTSTHRYLRRYTGDTARWIDGQARQSSECRMIMTTATSRFDSRQLVGPHGVE